MDKNKLKSAIVERGIRVEDFIEMIDAKVDYNFTKDAYYARMSGRVEFRRGEIKACKEVLSLSDSETSAIFFNDKVS